MTTSKSNTYTHSGFFKFLPNSNKVYLTTKEKGINSLYEISKKKQKLIWEGTSNINDIVIDNQGNRLAFISNSEIWLFNTNRDSKAFVIHIPQNKEFIELYNPHYLSFSPKGNILFFNLQDSLPPVNPNINPVKVFSYLNSSFDLNQERESSSVRFAYNCNKETFYRLLYDHDNIDSLSENEDFILIKKSYGNNNEIYWNKKSLHEDYILSLENGEKTNIPMNYWDNKLSPTGEFVIGYNYSPGDLYCFNNIDKTTYNLTASLSIPLTDNYQETPEMQKSRGLRFGNWVNNGQKVLIYDQYDIWILSLDKKTAPINITNGYGRKNHISFSIIPDNYSFKPGEEIILSAFFHDTKSAGFFKIVLGTIKDPMILSEGKQYFNNIKKADDNDFWIVKKSSAEEAPNYFSTSDFKNFHPLTDIHPERNYYWHTTELINYTTKDGIQSQAILYKPENFDSTKKYPVLLTFYEHESDKLNQFSLPGYTSYSFNIPLMISRGYLVCIPDIHFKIGETAHSIVDCVEGAVYYLSKQKFVDSLHFGASAGSFGGYGVNCLAILSKKFSALVPISGVSDLISCYGNVPGLRDEIVENRQLRMGVSLASDPQRYLRNSPIAYTKSVNTPILIINTILDNNVNIQQGIEWFISLRREGKPSWMLQYQHAGHGVKNDEDQKDLYLRMNQFFDHYLLGKPAPKWMTQELPIREQGVCSGLEYDNSIQKPPTGLLK